MIEKDLPSRHSTRNEARLPDTDQQRRQDLHAKRQLRHRQLQHADTQ